jgi:hypothetical protein
MKYNYKISKKETEAVFDNIFDTEVDEDFGIYARDGFVDLHRGFGARSQQIENTINIKNMQHVQILLDYISNHHRRWNKTAPLNVVFEDNSNIRIGGRCSLHQFINCNDGKLNDYIIIDDMALDMRDSIKAAYKSNIMKIDRNHNKELREENKKLSEKVLELEEKLKTIKDALI